MNFSDLTIEKTHNSLKKKEFSVLELVKYYLEKIEREDKKIHAFLTLLDEEAILQAKKIDEEISKENDFDILKGIPCAIKDNIALEGIKCTAGSKILENYIAPFNATVVNRLKSRGAIILGKTNLDEFAMGSSTENSAFGPTKNPFDLERVPGGSSGGSAAAVAADFCAFALGSDTGGSIRQPASFCGIVGLKPTYGAVSRYGLISMASSLDQIGLMTKTAQDADIVFDAISGRDEMDSTSVEFDKSEKELKISEVRIGIPKEYFIKGLDSEVENAVRESIKSYEAAGAKIEEITLPNTEYALSVYYIIAPSEISANLARYDGIKYGLSERGGDDLLSIYLKSREGGLGDEPTRRIMLGTYALSSGYYDAYYLRAQKVRTLIRTDFERAFEKVDFIMSPVAPTSAFRIGEKSTDPLAMYLSDIFTIPVNLAGLPAISIPGSFSGNLPVGLQIIGRPFEDKKILKIAKFLERNAKS